MFAIVRILLYTYACMYADMLVLTNVAVVLPVELYRQSKMRSSPCKYEHVSNITECLSHLIKQHQCYHYCM